MSVEETETGGQGEEEVLERRMSESGVEGEEEEVLPGIRDTGDSRREVRGRGGCGLRGGSGRE